MLAYVFWHVPRPGVTARDYETAHHAFHEALWQSTVPGLLGLRVYALPLIPWLEPQLPGYEDWHLLDDSAALDALNAAAVTHARQLPHDRIAAMAANGTAGLYGLRAGEVIEPTQAYWLSKPGGMNYESFKQSMSPLIDAGCCLWGRRMTLGPTPEFCLQAPVPIEMPFPARLLANEAKFSRGPR